MAPTLYLAHAQWPLNYLSLAVKARGEPSAPIEPMRGILRELDPDVPMFAVRSMTQVASNAMAQPRLYMVLIASFAGTALLLAAIGLYGVLVYAVGQRTREIGIRLALGARRAEVLRMVMSQAGRLVVIGVAVGLVAAMLASRLLRAQLFEVAPTNGDLRHGRGGLDGGVAVRELDSGASRVADRSDDRASTGLNGTSPSQLVHPAHCVH